MHKQIHTQIGECQRCGEHVPAKTLVHDGRNKFLLVCPSCYDPAHPAELPFKPKQTEGKPKFPVAPDLWPGFHPEVARPLPVGAFVETLVLAGAAAIGPVVNLSWSPAMHPRFRIARYEVFRDAVLRSTITLVYDDFGTPVDGNGDELVLAFVDNTVVAATSYLYRVDAVCEKTSERDSSNAVTVNVS